MGRHNAAWRRHVSRRATPADPAVTSRRPKPCRGGGAGGPWHLTPLVPVTSSSGPRHLTPLVPFASSSGARHLTPLVPVTSSSGARHLTPLLLLMLWSPATRLVPPEHLVTCVSELNGAQNKSEDLEPRPRPHGSAQKRSRA